MYIVQIDLLVCSGNGFSEYMNCLFEKICCKGMIVFFLMCVREYMVQKKLNDDLYCILWGISLLLFLSWDSDVLEVVFYECGF